MIYFEKFFSTITFWSLVKKKKVTGHQLSKKFRNAFLSAFGCGRPIRRFGCGVPNRSTDLLSASLNDSFNLGRRSFKGKTTSKSSLHIPILLPAAYVPHLGLDRQFVVSKFLPWICCQLFLFLSTTNWIRVKNLLTSHERFPLLSFSGSKSFYWP